MVTTERSAVRTLGRSHADLFDDAVDVTDADLDPDADRLVDAQRDAAKEVLEGVFAARATAKPPRPKLAITLVKTVQFPTAQSRRQSRSGQSR